MCWTALQEAQGTIASNLAKMNLNLTLEASTKQTQLNQLLAQNAEGQLSDCATATLDRLLAQVDYLNILRTRARYTLHHCERLGCWQARCLAYD